MPKIIPSPFKHSNCIYLLGLITLLFSVLLRNNPEFTTKYYSNGLYIFIANILSGYSSFFSFSIADITYVFLIAFVITGLIFLIFKRIKLYNYINVLFKTTIFIYVIFYWLWGFNYFGQDLYERNILKRQTISNDDYITILDNLIEATNSTCVSFNTFNKNNINNCVNESYLENQDFLKVNYPIGKVRTKTMVLSRYYSAAGIAGYFLPFFNEIHINKHLLPIQYPVVLAHEKAHQLGITSESDANFYAWYVCTKSKNKQCAYSANLYMLRLFLKQTNYKDIEPKLKHKLSKEVIADFETIKQHWAKHRISAIDNFNSWLYNKYLKANQITDGINNYNGVVKMICEYETKNN